MGNRGARLIRDGSAVRLTGALCLAAVVAGTASCAARGPSGDSGGVIDPYRRTQADVRAREADSVSLLEFSSQAGEALAARIGQIGEIVNRDSKVAVYLGAIENHTATPTSDFQQIRRRMFIAMVNSDLVRYHADLHEAPELMDRQLARLTHQQQRDLLQEIGNDRPGVERYNPEDVYVLQGNFSEIARGGGVQSTYNFDMTLTHLATGRILFAEQYDLKQVR